MSLLISDTNVLVDIEDGNLTSVIFQLSYEITVPDILFEAELREHHSHLLKIGLKIKSLTPESIKKADAFGLKYPRPGAMDRLALALAMQEQCPLLTGDKNLRTAAKNENIEVHGTVWIMEEFLKTKLINTAQAKISFDSMKANGSRLPWGDIEKLVNKYGLEPKINN